MPAVGFVDDTGVRVTFADALAGKGSFTIRRPLLSALGQPKESYADATVTGLLPIGMQRQRILRDRHDYYVAPDSQTRLMWGLAIPSRLEKYRGGGVLTEVRMVVDLDGLKVGGTADTMQLWQPGTYHKGWALEIVDWKTTNVSNVRHILAGELGKTDDGAAQLNAYWTLANISPDSPILKAGLKPEQVEPVLVLENLSRDHRDYEAARPGKGPYPRWHEPVEAKAAPVAKTLATIRAAVRAWKAADKLVDADLPPCDPDLLYGGVKCRNYCEISDHCRYAAENIAKLTVTRNF